MPNRIRSAVHGVTLSEADEVTRWSQVAVTLPSDGDLGCCMVTPRLPSSGTTSDRVIAEERYVIYVEGRCYLIDRAGEAACRRLARI